MTRPSINILGAGAVGTTLAYLLHHAQCATIQGIYCRDKQKALNALEFIGEGQVYSTIQSLPEASLTFITTPDHAIMHACHLYSQSHALKGHMVVHCSGTYTTDVLETAKAQGAGVASIHPMLIFKDPAHAITHFAGTYCAMEGSPHVMDLLTTWFERLGAIPYRIDPAKKTLYHTAGVFAANYVTTLAQESLHCLSAAGVNDELAMRIILHLMQQNLTHLKKTNSPRASLTGPIQRGDYSLVESHIHALGPTPRAELYKALGLATLPLTKLDQEMLKKLADLFR